MRTPSYAALHRAVQQLSSPCLHAAGSYGDLETLVQSGAPLNPVGEDEQSLVRPLIAAFAQHGDRIYSHMQLLILAGANPMLQGVFNQPLVHDHEEVMDYLLCAMFRAEDAGKPMRDETGQTPLHILATAWLWESSDNSPPWMAARYHPAWVDAPRNDGHTPLSLMWQEAIYEHPKQPQVGGFLRRLWKETQVFLDHGARLGGRGSEEVPSAAQTIVGFVESGLTPPVEYAGIVERARAELAAAQLAQDTPKVHGSGPGRRI